MPDDSYTTHSRCPVVRREKLTLIQEVEVGGRWQDIPFDREVLWIRETETQCLFMHKGVIIDEKGTQNDFYGFATSLDHDDCARFAQALKLDSTSVLAVVAIMKVFETPLLEDLSREGIEHNKNPKWTRQYRTIPPRWRYQVGGEKKRLERIQIGEPETVWSSLIDGLSKMPPRLAAKMQSMRAELKLEPLDLPIHEAPLPHPAGMLN